MLPHRHPIPFREREAGGGREWLSGFLVAIAYFGSDSSPRPTLPPPPERPEDPTPLVGKGVGSKIRGSLHRPPTSGAHGSRTPGFRSERTPLCTPHGCHNPNAPLPCHWPLPEPLAPNLFAWISPPPLESGPASDSATLACPAPHFDEKNTLGASPPPAVRLNLGGGGRGADGGFSLCFRGGRVPVAVAPANSLRGECKRYGFFRFLPPTHGGRTSHR